MSPGETTTVNVRFFNLGDNTISGIVNAADFIVDDKDGIPRIIDSTSQSVPKFAAANWFTLSNDRITILPHEKVTVQATIKVPTNAKAGGRYAAIYFESTTGNGIQKNNDQGVGVGIAPRVVALYSIRIPGESFEKAMISRLFTPFFSEYGPLSIETDILNRSDYHVTPHGIVSVTNMFGGLEDQQKIKENNIFPDASRTYTLSMGHKWMIGRYRIDLAASYGEKGQALSRFIYVWVFPWKIALAILLTIFSVFIFGRRLFNSLILREVSMEKQLEIEKREIDELKQQLKKKDQ